MAKIVINEISKNYAFTTNPNNFCSVGLPMTACWGPAFEDPESLGITLDRELEQTVFNHFPATTEGVEAFVSTYRGPAANYRSAKDYSYEIALTLLTAGYDVDVCRVCPGVHASATIDATIDGNEGTESGSLTLRAKYPGSFGNNLIGSVKRVVNRDYWNLIVQIVDSLGSKIAVENIVFTFDYDKSEDNILHVSEVDSNFFDLIVDNIDTDTGVEFAVDAIQLTGGSDRAIDDTPETMMDDAIALAELRYSLVPDSEVTDYKAVLTSIKNNHPSVSKAASIRYMEWNYNAAYYTMEILTDKLAYDTKRLIMPGWDDQNYWFLTGETTMRMNAISPLHARMMEVAAKARCMTALLDLPKSLDRSGVWNDSEYSTSWGYAQILSNYIPSDNADTDGLFSTHSALFGPWAQYKYAGVNKTSIAPPGFIALMIQLAMIRNQSLQYEWAQPTNRVHNLTIGSPDYRVPKKLLDNWQSLEGVSLNVITQIPSLGVTVWGNSTLYDIPPANYNALQNLSTRYLMNAVKDVVFRAGLGVTFQYNNSEAYSKFYVTCSPLLDTMASVGAITKYTIEMSKDLNALDSINFNSVVGTIQIWVEGVINDITVDLVALPAGTEND